MTLPIWAQHILDIQCTRIIDANETEKAHFLEAFDVLGEALLLALDGIDSRKYIRVVSTPRSESHEAIASPNSHTSIALEKHAVPMYRAKATNGSYYEIRLNSWHCTCTHFICGTFFTSETMSARHPGAARANVSWGGYRARKYDVVPFCKHMIAAFLLEYGGPLFVQGCEEQEGESINFTL